MKNKKHSLRHLATALLLVLCLSALLLCACGEKTPTEPIRLLPDGTYLFTTSDGKTFTADELDMTWGDLEELPEDATQQEVVDFFYERGYGRTEP